MLKIENGTRVVITAKDLKSCGISGTFVGMDKSGKGYKIYLDKPICTGHTTNFLITLTNTESFKLLPARIEKLYLIRNLDTDEVARVTESQRKVLDWAEVNFDILGDITDLT